MAPEPVTAERVYRLLKADVISGRFVPGSFLVGRTIAEELGVSVSPIRDGAQRLVGEGLLETAAGGGYRLPLVSQDTLRDLYSWHSHLLRLIIKSPAFVVPLARIAKLTNAPDSRTIADVSTDLFRSLATGAENGEYARALLAANDRLHAVRLREGRILPNLGQELQLVLTSTIQGAVPDRFDAIWAYHRRRIRRAGKLAEALYW